MLTQRFPLGIQPVLIHACCSCVLSASICFDHLNYASEIFKGHWRNDLCGICSGFWFIDTAMRYSWDMQADLVRFKLRLCFLFGSYLHTFFLFNLSLTHIFVKQFPKFSSLYIIGLLYIIANIALNCTFHIFRSELLG